MAKENSFSLTKITLTPRTCKIVCVVFAFLLLVAIAGASEINFRDNNGHHGGGGSGGNPQSTQPDDQTVLMEVDVPEITDTATNEMSPCGYTMSSEPPIQSDPSKETPHR